MSEDSIDLDQVVEAFADGLSDEALDRQEDLRLFSMSGKICYDGQSS